MRTMDSQGRKVVVCDNGTGVSARWGGHNGHRPGWGCAEDARAPRSGALPLGPRAAGAQEPGAVLSASADVGSERAESSLFSPSLPPPQPRVRAAARPAVDGDVACCPARAGFAPLAGQFGERVRGVKHRVCVFEKGSNSQECQCLKKEKDPEAFLFLYRYRTAGRKRL